MASAGASARQNNTLCTISTQTNIKLNYHFLLFFQSFYAYYCRASIFGSTGSPLFATVFTIYIRFCLNLWFRWTKLSIWMTLVLYRIVYFNAKISQLIYVQVIVCTRSNRSFSSWITFFLLQFKYFLEFRKRTRTRTLFQILRTYVTHFASVHISMSFFNFGNFHNLRSQYLEWKILFSLPFVDIKVI